LKRDIGLFPDENMIVSQVFLVVMFEELLMILIDSIRQFFQASSILITT